jgi:hypothetical protein
MRFDTKAESPKLFFQPVRWLTDDEYAIIKQQGDSTEAQRAVVMTVAQSDGVKPKAALVLENKITTIGELAEEDEAAAIAETKKAVKKKPVVEEESEEPEVRTAPAKTTAVPEKKNKLADIVADWDDE